MTIQDELQHFIDWANFCYMDREEIVLSDNATKQILAYMLGKARTGLRLKQTKLGHALMKRDFAEVGRCLETGK